MQIHHIGYAVFDIDLAMKQFDSIGYKSVNTIINDIGRNVRIAFLQNRNATMIDTISESAPTPFSPLIELIALLNPNSPVDNILQKVGSSPYHICYSVPNILETCSALKADGWQLIHKPRVAPAIDNAFVAFLYSKAIGIIELVELEIQDI